MTRAHGGKRVLKGGGGGGGDIVLSERRSLISLFEDRLEVFARLGRLKEVIEGEIVVAVK